jgi:NAD(P)-dependent dehydrogenase (short-subunit alcohol dehydrogenase family)
MPDEMDLSGRSALVTGAGRRLGRAFAEALAARGAAVAAHYGESAEGAAEVVRAAQERGTPAVALQADLADPRQTAALVDRAAEALGFVDVLVNSASVFDPGGPLETDLGAWERALRVNLTAPFLLSQAFARRRARDPGVIVNLLDWRALRPAADHFAYTISKAGLASMTKSLALSLAPSIRVNGLALGAILPPAGQGIGPDRVVERAPAGRWGTVEEAVEALLFLIGGSSFVTGAILHLDGGRHIG